MHLFRNDYSEGAAPEILQALVRTNDEQCVGYTEGDPHCDHARELIRAACGRDDVDVEFCIGGTSANIVGVTGMLHDWEGVICTKDAHINVHETGAIAACGRTVLTTQDADGFLSPEEAERVYVSQTMTGRHMTLPRMIYITDATEFGGVWTKARFDAICDWAKSHDLKIYVDGARMGCALTSEGNDLTLRHLAARADAFYLGGTKNGMLFGEAMVIADPDLKRAFPYLIKERGGLMAKGRLLGVQFEAAFETPVDGGEALYWRYARNANERALELRRGLNELGFESYLPANTNQQFFAMEPELAQRFVDAVGCETFAVLDDGRRVIRFVTSWATRPEHVRELLEFAEQVRG
ncbi:MAG: beta-eliminating lyase-related protein [Eggerthellaceae bacterium]|jgi:threonine aldolase